MDSIKKLIPFLFVVVLTGVAVFAFAQAQQRQQVPGYGYGMADSSRAGMDTKRMSAGTGMGMMRMDGMCMNNINTYLMHADDLKLTDQQVQQLRTRQTQFMQNSIQARAKLQSGMVSLCSAMDDPNMSMTQIRQRIQDFQTSLGEYLTQSAQAQVDARGILTSAQRQQALRYETSGMCAMMGMEKAMPDTMRETMPGMAPPRSAPR